MTAADASRIESVTVTCKEFIEDCLAEYVDGTLAPDAVADLESHLAACPACVAYLNTYRRTRDIVGRIGDAAMPPEMADLLRRFMTEHLKSPRL